jgi:Ca2+-binding RTX toxin-like protein
VNLSSGLHTDMGALPQALLGLTASADNLIRLGSPTTSVAEGAATVDVSLTRANPRGSTTVSYATAGGTATGGADYTAAAGSVTFTPGQTSKTISVPVTSDSADEPDETFDVTVTLPATSNASLLGPSTATATITDDDSPLAAPPPPDRDSDGVPDSTDNCANFANADQADGNGNGLGTVCDPSEPRPLAPGRCANTQTGTSRDDALLGTPMGDKLTGAGGTDSLFGAAGDDCLTGDAGDDWLSGGDGADDLRGGAGDDLVYGGAGNDQIDAGKGRDVVKAGTGNDTIKAKDRKAETIDCGAGKDTVTADKTDKLKGCETKKR